MNSSLLFLTGIPTGTQPAKLASMFSSIGFTVKIYDQKEQAIMPSRPIKNGYCLLETSSRRDYESLLDMKHVAYVGRRLIVKPYLAGVELYKENRKNNKRRVLLKQVPTYITDEEVKFHLCEKFGEIVEFYRLQSHKLAESFKDRGFKAFSVMFKDSVVEKVGQNTSLEIRNGLRLKLERFSMEKKKSTFLGSPTNQLKMEKRSFLSKGRKRSIVINPMKCFGKTCRKSMKFHSKSLPSADIAESMFAPATSNRSSSTGCSEKGDQSAIKKIKFLKSLLEACQFQKPNSKVYRLLRAHDAEYLGKFELKNSWIARSNFRENHQMEIF